MKHFYFVALLFLFTFQGFAQRTCATMEVLEAQQAQDPLLRQRMDEIEQHTRTFLQSDAVQSRAVVTIPVVVHVLYRTSKENISDAQIKSQIDVLNRDFKALNTDLNDTPNEFKSVIGNPEVEFCLAKQDPNGNATTGITRKLVNVSSWGINTNTKKSIKGGVDPWNTTKYLNIWVCNIGNGVLGYAQFPGGDASTDGVVIDYRYFGTTGTATYPFNRGRTATHEIGHWLNLRHIWGDSKCGDDFVNDTPTHNAANTGCQQYPHYSTCTGAPLEMTMNYMDYTDDRCMNMFSAGQVARMRAVFAPGGFRESLLSANGCLAPGETGGGNDDDGGEPPVTCNPPTGLNATNITTNSATLSWSTITNATGYNVRLRVLGTSTWTTATTNGTTYAAGNLLSKTTYEFQVQTICGTANSTNFTSLNFTTQEVIVNNDCNDSFESNNTQSTAKSIQINTPIKAILSSRSDLDWFRFTTSSSQRNVRIRMTNLPADYDLRLYRSLSVAGYSIKTGLTDEQIILNNASPNTTYSIRVNGYNGAFDANDCYDLIVETSSSSFRLNNEEILNYASFLLYPNPATNEILLEIPIETASAAPAQIQIFDVTGRLVQRNEAALSKENATTKVNVQNLSNGIYVVRVQSGEFVDSQKFVISK